MDAIEDEFDDFLNECFCKSPKEKQNEFVTHQIDSAAEDCAERALNDSDSDIKEEEGDKDAEDKKKSECEHEEPKNKRKKSSKSKTGSYHLHHVILTSTSQYHDQLPQMK